MAMIIRSLPHFIGAAVAAIALGIGPGPAHGQQTAAIDAPDRTGEPNLHETVTPVIERAIPNVPGRSIVAVVVSYPPGAKSAVHRHAPSAFIYAHGLSGAIRSQVDDGPATVYQAGEG